MDALLNMIGNMSVEFRLIINTIVIILATHLVAKRIFELRRRDFIFPFRVTLLALLTVVLAFSIPVEAYLIALWLGTENPALLNLARIAGGVVVIALVLTLEIIDAVIANINRRAKALEEKEDSDTI